MQENQDFFKGYKNLLEEVRKENKNEEWVVRTFIKHAFSKKYKVGRLMQEICTDENSDSLKWAIEEIYKNDIERRLQDGIDEVEDEAIQKEIEKNVLI